MWKCVRLCISMLHLYIRVLCTMFPVFSMGKYKVSKKIEKLVDENAIMKVRDLDATLEALSNPEALKKKYLNDLLIEGEDEEGEKEEEDGDDDEEKQSSPTYWNEQIKRMYVCKKK